MPLAIQTNLRSDSNVREKSKMPQVIELRPDRELINKDFEKYQFSADPIPRSHDINLQEEVYRIEPNSNQESLLEAGLFAFHNHLFKNPYDASCWFVDKKWAIWRLCPIGTMQKMHVVHTANEAVENISYNPSLGFTNSDITVVSDGGNCLKVLIGNTEENVRCFELMNAEPGIILDVQYIKTQCKLMIAMSAVLSNNDKKYTRVLLHSYTWKDPATQTESFVFLSNEELKVKGSIEYFYIEENGDYVHSIAQDIIGFENSIDKDSQNNIIKDEEHKKNPSYCWSQDKDSITVWLKVPEKDEHKVKINIGSTKMSVLFENNEVMKGEFYHRIDESLATWRYIEDKFEIDLSKHESGLMWTELIKGDNKGEYIPNEALVAEIHARLAHLCSDHINSKQDGQPCPGFNAEQLEECDLEGRDNLLQRINLTTQKTTQSAMLGVNNHVLFTYKTTSGRILCLRYDHDGCVWTTEETKNNEWLMKNVYNFPGFGYVEASKTNKKFCISPANGTYVAILEHKRHIFLYEKPKPNSKISKQWVVDLGADTSPIMGAAAMNKHLIVLTKTSVYYLQIYS